MRSYQEGIEECELAEEMGWWVSFSDHYSGRIATGTPAVMAAAVAERCKKAKIAMLGHLLTLNNPVRVAEELGLLDNLTNGRLIIGFLRGTPNEDQTYSVNPAEGRERLLEGMALVIKALTEPQPFSWEGRYYQFRTVAVWPRPVQQPCRRWWWRPGATTCSNTLPSTGWAWRFPSSLSTRWPGSLSCAWCAEAGWQPTRPDRLPGKHLPGGDGQAGGVVRVSSVQGQCPGADAACCVEGNTGGPGGRSVRPAQHPCRRCAGGRGWRCPRAELHGRA